LLIAAIYRAQVPRSSDYSHQQAWSGPHRPTDQGTKVESVEELESWQSRLTMSDNQLD